MADQTEQEKVKALSADALVEAFEVTVRWHHYDPFEGGKPEYTDLDFLREEILNRLKMSA